MVRVEPFVYQMVTAFKERIQMVSKINEIIDLVNEDVSIEEVRAVVTEMLSDYYDKEEIDEMFDSIDFSPYYTKTEVNAIVDRIDDDVDAVEGRMTTAEGDIDALEGRMDTAEDDIDAVEGRMTTAEGDIDNLETGKQNVLTAGDGIDITSDVISLDNGWEEVAKSEFYLANFDFDKYDYKIETLTYDSPNSLNATLYIVGRTRFDANKYYGFIVEESSDRFYHNAIVTPGSNGLDIDAKMFKYNKYTKYVGNNALILRDLDGTAIDASNFATYFDTTEMKCIKPCVLSYKVSTLYNANSVVMPNDTVITVMTVKDGTFYGIRQTVENLKRYIVDGSTSSNYRGDELDFRVDESGVNSNQNKYYRRIKV